jgi:phosphodiesterase/alkaline phosphatase D-like protein
MKRTLRASISRRVWSSSAIALAIVFVVWVAPGSLAVPQALAAAAPTATTGAAQQVEYASATVTGTVNPSGNATSYYFEYGTSSAYGMQTSATSAGAGTTGVAVQQPLSGLAASTTYDYRLVAVNSGGTVDGNNATFTTPKTPAPTATTTMATAVSSSAATLNGSLNPEGVPTTYYFQYGTTAAYGNKTATQAAGSASTAQAAAANASGLQASTTYHYRLVAVSAGGTVVGGDNTFATSKLPVPTADTGAVTGVTTATAVLNGTVNPEGLATSYYFQYGTSSGYGHNTSTRSAGSGTASAAVSQSLSGLAARTTYHYRIVAVSAAGTVDGRDATFATVATPAPTVTTGAVSAVTTTTATLTGSVDPHGIATTYHFEYGTKSPSTHTAIASAGAGSATVAVSVAISKLTPGTTYVYRLVAVGARTAAGATRSFTAGKIAASLSLRSLANPVGAGAGVTFNGTLSGTGVGVRTVALETEPYPYTGGFRQFGAAEQTGASGAFAFRLPALSVSTMVRAVTLGGSPSLATAVIVERAVVRINLHVRRYGRAVRFSGQIAPAGAPVQIQIERRFRGRWVTIVRTATHRISARLAAYGYTIRRPHSGRYRVVVYVRNGSLLSARSRVVTLH